MNFKLFFFFFLLFAVIYAVQSDTVLTWKLPARYEEIRDQKILNILLRDIGFARGIQLCQWQYERAGGGKNAKLTRTARYIANDRQTYYFINLFGKIGYHEFLFRVTYNG